MNIRRRHQAITHYYEKTLLDFLARKIYRFTSADQLSLLAFAGALLTAGSYLVAESNLAWLHLANFGIFLHWFGDSLDGRVARLRQQNRPRYGYYLDHLLDAISTIVIIFGINYSGLTLQSEWLWALILLLLIMIHTALKAASTGIFELSFERIGGTEVRISLIAMNIALVMTNNPLIIIDNLPFNLIDVVGLFIVALLFTNLCLAVYKTLWGKNKIRD